MPEQDDTEAERPEQSARGFWSGTLSFGLVSIPVSLYPASRSTVPGLRLLDQDGTPLARRYYCPADGKELTSEDLVRGYQLDDGGFVVVSDEELEALEPKKSRDIDLRLFVPVSAVDPSYYDRGYFLVPATESTKAYRLLAAVMERSQRVGIATFVMRGHEYLIAIEAHGGLLLGETLHFHAELRSLAEIGLPAKPRLEAAAVQRYRRAIARAAADELDARELRDETAEGLRQLAEAKRRRGADVVPVEDKIAPEAGAEVIDLMQVLKRSLAAQQPSAAAKKPAPHRPGPRKAKARPSPAHLGKRAVRTRHAG